jgi:predicted branched-subunit amino acid permease
MQSLNISILSALFISIIIFAGGIAMGCMIISIYNDHVRKRDLKEFEE